MAAGTLQVMGTLNAGTLTEGGASVPRIVTGDVPSGNVSAAITHSLGTKDFIIQIYRVSDSVEVESDVTRTSTTVVTLGFAVAPTAGQYRYVILG